MLKGRKLLDDHGEDLLHEIVHIHYRFAFYEPGFLRSVQPPLDGDSEILRWLERYLPLEATITNGGVST